MLYNPKTKQTIIRRSFTQVESSDPVIPSLPVHISDNPSDTIPTSNIPTVSAELPPEPTRSSKRLNQHHQHEIPYLLRSRSPKLPRVAHNIILSNTSSVASQNDSPSGF